MMAEFGEPPAKASVLRGVGGCCPYCHQRTKGTWRIKVEVGPLWPHRVTCPQCHQAWDSIRHFNQDAKRIIVAVLKDSPDRIEEMNRTAEQCEWDSTMADNIARHKDVQDFEWKRKFGRRWSPYDGLLSEPKRYWTQTGGPSGDDQDGDRDGGGVGERGAPDSGKLQGGAEDEAGAAGQDSDDN